jgi:IclR family KDG regulon transcriptional repressor
MTEQQVQYNEQSLQDTNTPAPAVPAPMVERAFRLLDLLSVSEEGLTLSDLARSLCMSKGSVHGLLKTLESNGVIELSEDRRYSLGPQIYDLAQSYVQRAGLRRFSLPAMHRLANSIEETVFLGHIEQDCTRIIERVQNEGDSPGLHVSAPRGARIPLLVRANGPLILASWSRAQREAYLLSHPLPQFTEHSITDPQQFLKIVEEVARNGISFDHEEYLAGVNAVAAPIYGPGGTLIALIWIVGFASRFHDEAMQQAATQLIAETAAISRSLGAK